jgi:membrane-associated phospholipid phosphatase
MAANPMVTSSLITGREGIIAGDAVRSLHQPPAAGRIPAMPYLVAADVMPWPHAREAANMQANVRMAMAESELYRSINITNSVPGGKDSAAHRSVVNSSNGAQVVTLDCPKAGVFEAQLPLVESYSALRAERQSEVLTQVVPQIAHWSAIAGLSAERHKHTLELMGATLRFVMVTVMQLKAAANVKRPAALSAVIQPMIQTPGYTAYPSGHATEASFIADLLPILMGDPSHPLAVGTFAGRSDGVWGQLYRLAHRVAENRVVAGLHYPVDSVAGMALGTMLSRHVLTMACPSMPTRGGANEPALNPNAWMGAQAQAPTVAQALSASPVFGEAIDKPGGTAFVLPPSVAFAPNVHAGSVLADLWQLARREWV